LLVGDGPAYGGLYTLAKKAGLLSNIHFTGPVLHNEIPDYIAAMDIVIQPFATEYACPMKIIEYLSMGKCIVAIDQPNIRELIEDGVTGFLFNNAKTMASILAKLISHPWLRTITGQKALESIAKRELFWTANAQRTLSLIMGD
jgi:glycosyltransferase involved in cell wall biosynthesis